MSPLSGKIETEVEQNVNRTSCGIAALTMTTPLNYFSLLTQQSDAIFSVVILS